ncbi:exodeoxyribonuclease III [Roseospira marina]|uniref:Exodeoxyribonuclease III n=1 Tax=Roseospira marina TaxID=140057 RepID=A0A5M6IGP6_9PROT|nr:exodeoxyribonuclease III [Roseospira marina]KAA5607481.1 exodeoxyribonuclease III [Roseospira marina]MBB4312338.1 exodeoxyribonuclease-3 [Roseospira marina]MBB5085646.1 exodeoxyribonuclease-3 [Roseospira marina]
MPTIATWNVNSIKARLPAVLSWLEQARPDVALLQEIKTVDDGFPVEPIEDLGYQCAVHGQKTYNGVAILSRIGLEDVSRGLPSPDGEAEGPDGMPDEQARYIEAVVGGTAPLRVASIYLPNGNPSDSPKFTYKVAWMDRLRAHAARLVRLDEAVILAGDYNVCPTDGDVYDPAGWADDALCRPESRERFRGLLHLGYTDAIAVRHPRPGVYTFWDYQGGAWQKDNGLRIDHLLLSPLAADRLDDAGVDRGPRGQPKASDHTPAWVRLRDA